MAKEQLIPKDELDYQTKEYIKDSCDKTTYDILFSTARKDWTKDQKELYKNARATIYARLRAELKRKSAKMWVETLTAGNLEPWLKNHGINVYKSYYSDDVYFGCKQLANQLVKHYIEKVIIPGLEKDLNITGVKMTRNTTSDCQNCLDFSRAQIKSNNK